VKYGKSGAQVALVWVITHGRSVIPKNKTECRTNQDLEGDFKLSAEEVERMESKMDRKLRFNNPSESFA
jgi:diketogulonate reductase-like aldo/keto reductase